MSREQDSRIYWYQNLSGGMNQSTDPSLVENNESPLLKNMVLDQLGNYASRKGTIKIGGTTAGDDRIWGLGAYYKTGGSRALFRICNRDLEKFNGTDTWTVVDTDEWPASTKVNTINFLNRMYLGSADGATPLSYTTTTTITDVDPLIGGHLLATNKAMLAVGGNSIKGNVILFTDPYTDQFYKLFGDNSISATCGANADVAGGSTVTITESKFPANSTGCLIYNTTEGTMNRVIAWISPTVVRTDAATSTWDNDTVYLIKNNYNQDGPCTGIVGYNENFVSFDEDKMYIWDPASKYSKIIPGFGCVNERSIQVVDGVIIWGNRDSLYMFDGSRPIDITEKVRDKVDLYGIWNLINSSNWDSIASGPHEGKYYLSLGTLSTLAGAPASAMANAELVLDLKKSAYTVNSREDMPVVYAEFINSAGAKDLYYGEKTNLAVYKANTGTTDATDAGGTATINMDARTSHFTFTNPLDEWRVSAYYVKYRSGGNVTVTQSIDRGSYTAVDTLSSSSAIKIDRILPPAEAQGHTFSLSFACTNWAVIEAVGFEAEPIDFTEVST